jgi:hypothetical protein
MQTALAQMVALTGYGNAAIHGEQSLPFSSTNSTCQFCEGIKFIAGGKIENGVRQVLNLSDSPDEWLRSLPKRGIKGLRLQMRARNNPQLSDRLSAGFVGGGREWKIEGLRRDSASEFWLSKWEVGNKGAADRRIWRVTYGLCEVSKTPPQTLRSLEEIIIDLHSALIEIRAFSETNRCGSFAGYFTDGLRALEDPKADIGFHKDLFPTGTISDAGQSVLKAAMGAWVFGGMGSWNDMGFDGEKQIEYERVSDKLFNLLNEGVEAATTSSFPGRA